MCNWVRNQRVYEQPCLMCEKVPPATNNELVGTFHDAFGVEEPAKPTAPHREVKDLRLNLMDEELAEVTEALDLLEAGEGSLAEVAKELADLLVVTYGTARVLGIDIDPIFRAVMAANMSKLGEDGKPIRRADGKVLKGPNYQPAEAEVERLISEQSK